MLILNLIMTLMLVQDTMNGGGKSPIKIEESNPNGFIAPYEQLNLKYGLVPLCDIMSDFIRQGYDPKFPGDYFRAPEGIESNLLSAEKKKAVQALLGAIIDSSLYDNYVLNNLSEYLYSLNFDKIERDEFYVRYILGDTVYVISGWIGKFISFYRAVPGSDKLTIRQLQDEITIISPLFPAIEANRFRDESKNEVYFFEVVDQSSSLRMRNYTIKEEWVTGDSAAPLLIKPYNLIEITKFIDKEMIP